MNAREQIDQMSAIGVGETGKGLGANFIRQIEDAGEDMARLLGQNEATGAAISGIEVSFDPAVLLHAIDLANQQLQLAGNVKAALIALQNADTRLQRMDRPQLTGLRKALNHGREIDPIRTVRGAGYALDDRFGRAAV